MGDTTIRLEENPFDDMLEDIPVVTMHRGFFRALIRSKKKLILLIKKVKEMYPETKDFPVFVTGHSQGGALATLFGYYLSQESSDITAGKPVQVYTFAAPPVGDKDFAKVFRRQEESGKIRLARFYNSRDPIPHAFAMTKYVQVGMGI